MCNVNDHEVINNDDDLDAPVKNLSSMKEPRYIDMKFFLSMFIDILMLQKIRTNVLDLFILASLAILEA